MSSEIADLDCDSLASWLATSDVFQEACKFASLAPRESDEATDAASIEAFALETLDPSESVETHPVVTAFIKRQSISGIAFCAPRFIPDILLPYLVNLTNFQTPLDKLLVGSSTTSSVLDLKRAYAFDAHPDSQNLLIFLTSLLDQRLNGEIELREQEYSVRSLMLLHYALRVVESGNTMPVDVSANASTCVSPARNNNNNNLTNINSNNSNGTGASANMAVHQMSQPGSLPCSLPASPTSHKHTPGNAMVALARLESTSNYFVNESSDNNGDLPPLMIGAGIGMKTPALPKQEPLSGSRRQTHRRWQEWRDIGKKAFEERNLPVSVDCVSYTPLACFTEALEEFLLTTGGGVCAALNASTMLDNAAGGSTTTTTTATSNRTGGISIKGNFLDLPSSPEPVVPGGSDAADNFAISTNFGNNNNINGTEDLATAEAELWALLSRAMPLGKSAVTISGQMHTKESAMAKAVQCDTSSAERWLELARFLPSETGKKRISKKKKNSASASSKAGKGLNSSNGSTGSPARGRNFGNLLNFGSPTPNNAGYATGNTSVKRKFNLNFDEFGGGGGSSPAAGHNNNNASGFFDDNNNNNNNNGPSRKPMTREFPPLVEGRVINRVTAYSESLKLDPSRADVWSELGLHMPLHPPNDSVFVNNSSYNSRRCHENALEMDSSLADSWLDLGWQLLEDKKSTAINGQVYNATECFKEALIKVPTDLGEAWSLLAQSLPDSAAEKVEISGETYTKVDCFRQALRLDPQCISAWIGLGRMLPRGDTTTVNGKIFTQLALFYHALEMDDSDAVAWNGLGAMLGPTDKAVFRGEPLTRRQCYLRALDCDPYLARVWNNLGLDLGDPRVDRNDEGHMGGRTVDTDYVHFAGKKYDSKAAFIRALHCEGGNVSTSWVNLGMLLRADSKEEGGTATVCGKTVDKKRCYFEAVRSNERNAIAWNNLGAVMSPDESVVLNNVTKDKLECYRHALENDDSLSNAWYNVVCVIMNKEAKHEGGVDSIKFKVKGVEYNKIKCLLNAVQTSPENGNAWKMLMQMMEREGVKEFTKKDGSVLTKKECQKMCDKYPTKD